MPIIISGADVAKPTIIKPIINGDMLSFWPRFAVASIKKCELAIRRPSPRITSSGGDEKNKLSMC